MRGSSPKQSWFRTPTRKMIRIANGQGFWGDSLEAPVEQVRRGPIDYLTLDYLAEVTMSILQKQRSRDPKAGYARDFVDMIARGAAGSGGTADPRDRQRGRRESAACREAVLEIAQTAGHRNQGGDGGRRRHSGPPGRSHRSRRRAEEHGDGRAALHHSRDTCRAPTSTSARSRSPKRWRRARRS